MSLPQKRDTLAGYALAAAIGIVALIVVSLIGMSQADAGGYRQRAVCNVVQAAPVYQQAAVVYPGVIGYQVGQALQQQSVDEYGFRASASQQRLTFLEGYYEATQRLTDSGAGVAGPSQPASLPAATEGGQTTPPQYFEESTGRPISPEEHERWKDNAEAARNGHPIKSEPQAFSAPQPPELLKAPNGETVNANGNAVNPETGDEYTSEESYSGSPQPPAAPASWPENGLRPAGSMDMRTGQYAPAPFAATHPTLDASCKSCHESEETKGKFSMAKAVTTAQAGQDFEKLNAIALSILSGEMPKGKTLSEKEKSLAVYELLSE